MQNPNHSLSERGRGGFFRRLKLKQTLFIFSVPKGSESHPITEKRPAVFRRNLGPKDTFALTFFFLAFLKPFSCFREFSVPVGFGLGTFHASITCIDTCLPLITRSLHRSSPQPLCPRFSLPLPLLPLYLPKPPRSDTELPFPRRSLVAHPLP